MNSCRDRVGSATGWHCEQMPVASGSGRMVRLQSSGSEHELSGNTSNASDGPDEAVAFPPTYIVVKFSKNISGKALLWIVDKIRGKRRDGGAELLVRRQPSFPDEGITIHVSASKIKFLEVAEELDLKKRDKEGVLREFTVSQLEEFLEDGMQMDDLLTTAERQHIVRHELENIRALMEDDHVPGHDGLCLYEGQSILQACMYWELVERMYPLHDRHALEKLGKKWYRSFFRKQPFEEIRLYFGEAVALYFAFLGFYTTALVMPMILGFVQLLVSAKSFTFFCVFNVVWVTIFLEIWKRKCNELAFTWGTINMTSLDDDPRPNFRGQMGVDRVTGRIQPQFPRWRTYARMYCISFPVVVVCMMGAFVVMLVSFWAEEQLMARKREQDYMGSSIVVMLPSMIYTGLVYIMNLYYRRLATYLTEWENHRTQSQYDRHRVTKLVLFEFVNNFMSLFYIAFYIQDMDMLRTQLAVMLIILQAINNFQEALLPLVLKYYGEKVTKIFSYEQLFGYDPDDLAVEKSKHRRKLSDTEPALLNFMQIVPELEMDDPRILQANDEGEMDFFEGTYDDYLELFVQFGYVLLFSSVYPIAAFWAVVNNIIEIRADAFKLCRVFQRPMNKKVKDNGAWQIAFEAIGAMSVMTNCGLMCISPNLRQLRPEVGTVEWVLFFVFLEHILLLMRQILHKMIPDRPEWVRVALAKHNYQSKQALKNERLLKNRRQVLQRKYRTIHGPHKRSQ